MSNFSALKTAIQNAIKQNGNEEITGNLLQNILISVVETLGDSAINTLETGLSNEATTRGDADTQLNNLITGVKNNVDNGYVYAGIATPSTTPVSGKVFYIALQAGTYTNFGSQVVLGGITILKYNGSAWSKEQVLYTDGGVFDISAYNATGVELAKYVDLAAALGTSGANIPQSIRKGGMSVKFVHTSDNKYVQFRLMSDSFNTTVANWQGVDDEPTAGNDNLVKSGGTADNIDTLTIRTGNDYHKIFQGNTTVSGIPNPNASSRIRTGIFDNSKPVHVLIPNGLVLYTALKYTNGNYNSYIDQVTLNRTGEYICNFGCYVILVFKKSDNSDLTPADAAGVEIASVDYLQTKSKIDNVYISALKSDSGEAQANNDYFDLGQIALNAQGIPVYGVSDTRVRTKQGVKFYMSAGDVIKINGIRLAPFVSTDGEHYTAIGWQTADYTIVTSGYYIFNCTYPTESTITTLESILDNIELVVSGVTKNLAMLVKKNVDALNGKIQGVAFDSLTTTRKVDYIPENNGKYANFGKNYKSAVFPVKPNDIIAVKVNTGNCFGAFVKSYAPTEDNLNIDYCAGTTRFLLGGFSYYTAPADAAYFIVTIRYYGVDTIFDILTINGIDITSSVFRNISELSLGKGNADYYGLEKISFDISTKKYKCQKELIMTQTVSEAGENQFQQGLAIYNGKIFSCIDYNDKVHDGYVYDFNTKELLGYIDSDIANCHYNNIQFTDIFYDENDEYPLMLVSQYEGHGFVTDNKLFIVRITANGSNYQMTTVKTIIPSSNMIGCYYGCTYAYNHTTNEIVAWMSTYYSIDDRTEKNKTQIYIFKCPDLTDTTDFILNADNANKHFTLPFHLLQGGTCKNGMLILPIQWTKIFDDVEIALPYGQNVLEFIDLSTGVVKAFVLINRTLEPEGCCIYDNKVYVAYHNGSATDPDAECFRIESYEFN